MSLWSQPDGEQTQPQTDYPARLSFSGPAPFSRLSGCLGALPASWLRRPYRYFAFLSLESTLLEGLEDRGSELSPVSNEV